MNMLTVIKKIPVILVVILLLPSWILAVVSGIAVTMITDGYRRGRDLE